MTDEDDCESQVVLEPLQEVDKTLLTGLVDSGRGLVEQQQVRPGGQPQGDVGALQLTARQ